MIFAAYYMLPMVQTMFFNKLDKPENREIQDLSRREMVILAPLCALMIVIGWNPTPILERMEPSVRVVLERVEAAAPAGQASVETEDGLRTLTHGSLARAFRNTATLPWRGSDSSDSRC